MLAQLEGSGRGNLASYNAQGFTDLSTFMEQNPLRDGDEWLGMLMKRNEMLGASPADGHAERINGASPQYIVPIACTWGLPGFTRVKKRQVFL